MKKLKAIVVAEILPVIMVLAFITLIQPIQNPLQAQTPPKAEIQNERAAQILEIVQQNGDPVADFFPIQPRDEESRRLRGSRDIRFNWKGSVVDPSRKYLTEIGERTPPISFGGLSFNLPNQPALPVDKSPQIVVGKITTAKAFLSEDWTAVYTEFGFSVERVLKDTANLLPSVPANITLLRHGGKVKLPESERIVHKGTVGKPLPKLEKRYLFLLSYEPAVKAYHIDIAYELKDGKVVPYDGRDIEGNYLRRFTSYQQYEGKNEYQNRRLLKQIVYN